MQKIKVKIAAEEISYPIVIGSDLLDELGELVSAHYGGTKIFIVTDENVNEIYSERILSVLENSGFEPELYVVPSGEEAKSFHYLKQGYDLLINNNYQRDHLIMALGGGVPGDLAGYLAASYMRGVPYIQVPTTLLAQVDSSVGGKTAVNHTSGKNLIGAFYQPDLVIIDIDFLQTLGMRELKTGIAEVIKYGLIVDREFFYYLLENKTDIYNLATAAVIHIVKKSCSIKAGVVSRDQREKGERALLNFGHTIGHALEAVTKYSGYNHGEAVAIGMLGASRLSYHLGYLNRKELEQIENIIGLYELPDSFQTGDADPGEIYSAMWYDKKVKDNSLRWILLDSIGKAFITRDVPKKDIKKVLEGLK